MNTNSLSSFLTSTGIGAHGASAVPTTAVRPARAAPAPRRVELVEATGTNETLELAKQLVSGGMGGIAQVIAGHPLDLVKTKLQVQSTSAQHTGMVSCFRNVLRTEGVAGLYAGAFAPLAGAMLHNANIFFSYGLSKKAVHRLTSSSYATDEESTENNMASSKYFVAGALAGVVISGIETPVDLLKIKMQAQGTRGLYSGSVDCARKIYASYGVRGLWQGTGATIVRNIPAFGCYFGCYEFAKRTLTPEGEKPTLMASFIGGSCAGFGFWATVYPLELVKTRMQGQSADPAKRLYTGVVDCFRKCLAQEGWAGLYKGFVPCVTRAVPVNGAIFLAVATAKSLISGEEL